MTRTAFYGRFEHCASERISNILTGWLGTSDVNAKDRLFGFELVYEDSSIYLYCYEVRWPDGGSESFYLLEGVIEQAGVDAVERLTDLVRLAAAKSVECVIDYTPVDSDDTPVGEEQTIT